MICLLYQLADAQGGHLASIAHQQDAVADGRHVPGLADQHGKARQLLDAGPAKCAKKLGEEAVETVMAGAGESAERLKEEAADLLYHLHVLLESRDVAIADVLRTPALGH